MPSTYSGVAKDENITPVAFLNQVCLIILENAFSRRFYPAGETAYARIDLFLVQEYFVNLGSGRDSPLDKSLLKIPVMPFSPEGLSLLQAFLA